MNRLNLDHNATTPIDPSARDALVACLDRYHGNPSSVHAAGQDARRAVDAARQSVARLIHATLDETIFTSGGTEANNLAIFGIMDALAGKRQRIVCSAVEHRAVLEPCRYLARHGVDLQVVGVDASGRIDEAAIAAAITDETGLVSVMLANNDIGTIQPVAAIAALAHARGALVHCDAVQAAGRIPIDVDALGVDLLSVSAHKLYGPKGVGALFMRRGTTIIPRVHGGRQERNRRAGTENVACIAGFGAAADSAGRRLLDDAHTMSAIRDHFEQQIRAGLPRAQCFGTAAQRLPNTCNIGFPGIAASRLVIALDLVGVAASTGAACSAAEAEPSYILMAMGHSAELSRSSLRFSFGRHQTIADADRAAALVIQTVRRLQGV